MLGFALGLLVRAWVATLRVSVVTAAEACSRAATTPQVVVFWHGQQMALLRWPRRRPLAVLVSWSRDGELQSGVMKALGMVVVRGSSSRGGASGLKAIVRCLREAAVDAAFAVDGPRGPKHRAKPGASSAARLTAAGVVPLGCAAARATRLLRTWDEFEIPWPFTRVVIVAGPPLIANSSEHEVENAIQRACDQARDVVLRRASRADGAVRALASTVEKGDDLAS
jgi:hypothetical protein